MAKITKSNPYGRGREKIGDLCKVNTNWFVERRVIDKVGLIEVRRLASDFINDYFKKLK